MLPPYPGVHLSFVDQLELLKQRGLEVTNEPLAIRHLERIGYYRLKPYLFPFRATQNVTRPDGRVVPQPLEDFRPGTKFQDAVELYVFDKRLRLLLSDGIERVEVALRVDLAHQLGQRDVWAHRDPAHLDPTLQNRPAIHPAWLARAATAEGRAKSDWVTDFRNTFSSHLPIWMAVETWEFGTMAKLTEMAHPVDRTHIAQKYGIPRPKMLASWIRTLGYVRNSCAHHSRVWNHPLVIQPMVPAFGSIPDLNQLSVYEASRTRVYAAAAITQFFLKVLAPHSGWRDRLNSLWGDFPPIPGISPAQAGFMPGWRTWSLWQ